MGKPRVDGGDTSTNQETHGGEPKQMLTGLLSKQCIPPRDRKSKKFLKRSSKEIKNEENFQKKRILTQPNKWPSGESYE